MATHGMTTTYRRGCRCEPCSQAGAEYQKRWREHRKQETGLPTNPNDWFTYIDEGDTTWMTSAACRHVDTAMFFPGRGETVNIAKAKAVCADCPVQPDCLAYAIRTNQKVGIWGGQSGRGLRALRNEYTQADVA